MGKGEQVGVPPESVFDRLPGIVTDVVSSKRASLIRDFGDATDFGIKGVVVVGDRERGTLDGLVGGIDLFLITTTKGFEEDFGDMLGDRTKLSVSIMGTIPVGEGQQFTDEDWRRESRKRGLLSNPYKIILVE